MKDTGIVRRIDELGRIVIPKEIRRTLRLGVGTQMEIYTSPEGNLVLKKYSSVNEIISFAESFCNSLATTTEKGVFVTDTDYVLSCANISKKEYLNKPISSAIEKLLNERKSYILNVAENATTNAVVENDESTYSSQIIVPIIASSDVVGAIIMVANETDNAFNAADVKVVQTVALLFSSILE